VKFAHSVHLPKADCITIRCLFAEHMPESHLLAVNAALCYKSNSLFLSSQDELDRRDEYILV
jgi:hypothetical protein